MQLAKLPPSSFAIYHVSIKMVTQALSRDDLTGNRALDRLDLPQHAWSVRRAARSCAARGVSVACARLLA